MKPPLEEFELDKIPNDAIGRCYKGSFRFGR